MSRPIKRGFSQSDALHNNSAEGQCDFNMSSVKRLRQDQSGVRNVSAAPHSMFIRHGALLSEAFNLTSIHASTTNIVMPDNGILFHDSDEWPSNLQNDLLFQLPDFVTSHDSSSFGVESMTVAPHLNCTQAAETYLKIPITSDYSELDELVLHQAYADETFPSGFGDVYRPQSSPQTHAHFLASMDMSCMNDVSWDAWNTFEWVNGHSSLSASLSLLPDTTCSRASRFDESMSCSKNYLPVKSYRAILPLLQKETGPQEDSSASGAAESPQRHKPQKNGNSEGRPKLGRSKSLAPEKASAIAEMRVLKACLRCRIRKVGCSPGEVCDTCLTSAFGLERTLCVRNNVDYSTELLFPSIVNSHFQKSSVENLIYENVESFGGNKISVQISSGPTYPPISLWVEEFRPINEDFLALPHVKIDEDGRIGSQFIRGYTPPLALPPHVGKSLRKKCQEHVDLIAQGPRSEGELYYKHTSIIPWEVYKAIEKYHGSTKDELVGKSMVLYAMHFFMTQILLFTEDSADSALNSLSHPAKLPYTRSLTSRLISLQIKQEMHDLAHKATKEVLKLLEDTMIDGSRKRKLWTPSFCAISILCMCIETVQIATDFKIVHSIIEGEKGPENSRSESKNQCQRLDHYVMITLETMFHRVFKSRKRPGSRKNQRGFNPIRDGVDLNDAQGLDTAGVILVTEIRRITVEKEKEIAFRLGNPSFDTYSDDDDDLLARHLVFREKNSGRLLSRFLYSFFKSE